MLLFKAKLGRLFPENSFDLKIFYFRNNKLGVIIWFSLSISSIILSDSFPLLPYFFSLPMMQTRKVQWMLSHHIGERQEFIFCFMVSGLVEKMNQKPHATTRNTMTRVLPVPGWFGGDLTLLLTTWWAVRISKQGCKQGMVHGIGTRNISVNSWLHKSCSIRI